MAHPFFEATTYPWNRRDADDLFEALVAAITANGEIVLIFERCGGMKGDLVQNQSPRDTWKMILDLLANGGLLRKLCDELKEIQRLRNSESFQAAVQAIVDAVVEPVGDIVGVTKERAADPGLYLAPPADWISRARDITWRYKVVGLDLDGTLLRGEDFVFSWETIWDKLNFPREVQRQLRNEYREQSANASRADRVAAYSRWCEHAVRLFARRRLTRDQLRNLSTRVRLTAHCREALIALREAGLTTAIISGGVNTFLDDAFPDYRDYVDFVFINELTFGEDGIVRGVNSSAYDFEGKSEALELVCQRVGCDISESVFVGDEFNDEAVMRRAALAIAYPPNARAIEDASNIALDKDDLRTILPYVLVK